MQNIDIVPIIAKAEDYMNEQAYPEAITLCKEALQELGESGHTQENERKKMQLLFCLSDICHVSGNWMDGLMYLSTVLNNSSKLNDPDIRGEAIIRSGDILSKMGKWDKAMDKYSEGEKLVKQFKNPSLLGKAHVGRGVVLWRQGKYAKAMECAEEGYNIGDDINDLRLMASASSLKASIHFDNRNYQGAIQENDRALESFRSLNDNIEVARILNNKGEVFKVKGEYRKAIEVFKEGLEVLSSNMNNRSLAYLYTNLAECQSRTGDVTGSQATLKLADSKVKLSEDRYIKAQLMMVKGLVEHSVGNTREALRHIDDAEAMMRKLDIPYDMGIIHLEHARILKDTDRGQAFSEYRNAIVSFQKAENIEKMKLAQTELSALGI